MRRPLLIVLSGLPGSGKTTLARGLAARLNAVHLRIDTIEQALRTSPFTPVEVVDHGYRVAMALARDTLALGHVVIGDAVNGMAELEAGWAAAADGLAPMVALRVLCSDAREHRARVEGRRADLPGHVLPTWAEVRARSVRPDPAALVLDTAGRSQDASLEDAITLLDAAAR